MEWIAIKDRLPEHDQRVLVWIPDNRVTLAGSSGNKESRPCIIMRFQLDFFKEGNPKREKFGPHFWLGEGQSNHYFDAVSHWAPLPGGPP